MEPLTGQAPTTQALATALLDVIRDDRAANGPLDALDPSTYARDHAAFEARSDQRSTIVASLLDRLAARHSREGGAAGQPIAVLSVGCGDGSVDGELARALVTDDSIIDGTAIDGTIIDGTAIDGSGPTVRYVGVEPFDGSADAFAGRMAAIGSDRLDASVRVATFEQALADGLADERFDVITFVHSMYYVPDVALAVRAAYALLRPGGELIVLSAPRGALNQLASVLAPSVDGHRQWFSDDVARGFAAAGFGAAAAGTLDARVDLTDAGRDVLDLTVQATLNDEVLPLVTAYLAEVSVTPDSLVVPHPVDVYRTVRPR